MPNLRPLLDLGEIPLRSGAEGVRGGGGAGATGAVEAHPSPLGNDMAEE